MDISALRGSLLFRTMTEEQIRLCLKELRAQEKEYNKGTVIMQAGDLTDRMGLVLSGNVTIESNDVWGNSTLLSNVSSGQFFAEAYALLPGEVMPVDVRANEKCSILFLTIGGLLTSGTMFPWKEILTQNLLTISLHKNLTLSGRNFHTAPKSARGRILSYLNTVSLQKQSREFDIPFDRQQLADYLNLERTNMSKELSRMKRKGLIECRKNHFRLLDS